LTVTAPNSAATTTSTIASNDARKTPPGPATPGSRRLAHAVTTSATMASDNAAAPYRCEISTRSVGPLCAGVNDPKQSGQ